MKKRLQKVKLKANQTISSKKLSKAKSMPFTILPCLVCQKYIKDDSQSIADLVNKRAKEVGKPLEIVTLSPLECRPVRRPRSHSWLLTSSLILYFSSFPFLFIIFYPKGIIKFLVFMSHDNYTLPYKRILLKLSGETSNEVHSPLASTKMPYKP